MTTISAKIENNDKNLFETIINSIGLNVTTAITAFVKATIRENGIPFSRFEAEGYHSPLLSIETQFIKPCRYGEVVDIQLQLSQIDRLRFCFTYKVTVGGELRTTGKTTHIFTFHDKPCRQAPQLVLDTFFPSENPS